MMHPSWSNLQEFLRSSWAGPLIAIMGFTAFISGTIVASIDNHIDGSKFAALTAQSNTIISLSKDPNNLFSCDLSERLEAVVEDYRDAQIVAEHAAIVRDRAIPLALKTHLAMYDLAVSDKQKLVELRLHNCIDVTRLITK